MILLCPSPRFMTASHLQFMAPFFGCTTRFSHAATTFTSTRTLSQIYAPERSCNTGAHAADGCLLSILSLSSRAHGSRVPTPRLSCPCTFHLPVAYRGRQTLHRKRNKQQHFLSLSACDQARCALPRGVEGLGGLQRRGAAHPARQWLSSAWGGSPGLVQCHLPPGSRLQHSWSPLPSVLAGTWTGPSPRRAALAP